MTLETGTFITAIIGAITGVGGLTLGIVSWIRDYQRDKVRLRVVPKIGFVAGNGFIVSGDRRTEMVEGLIAAGRPRRLAIEVTNLSAFAITVSEVGFGKTTKRRHVLVGADLSPPGLSLPVRLEPRQSFTAYSQAGQVLDADVMTEALAHATTDCGYTAYGTSPILKDYVSMLHSERKATS